MPILDMPEYPVLLYGLTTETLHQYLIISVISISYYSFLKLFKFITYSLYQTEYNALSTDLHL